MNTKVDKLPAITDLLLGVGLLLLAICTCSDVEKAKGVERRLSAIEWTIYHADSSPVMVSSAAHTNILAPFIEWSLRFEKGSHVPSLVQHFTNTSVKFGKIQPDSKIESFQP